MQKVNKETLASNKSQLAKLMANENITVRHRPIKTAKFDMKQRVLHCPIWEDMNGNIYDLLMGHEISHALHTPLLGWHDTITSDIEDKGRPKIKGFLNIIEDARIEKLVKRKYPGLRRPFADAYKELFERDMFKVKKYNGDYSKLRLIDRINLYFKVGATLNISFDKEEQKFVDRAEDLESFEDAAQLARDIYDYAKNKEPQKQKKKEEDAKNPPKQKPKKGKKPPKSGEQKQQCDDPGEQDSGSKSEDGQGKPKKDAKSEAKKEGGKPENKPGNDPKKNDEESDDGDSTDDTDIHNEDEPDEDSSPKPGDSDDENDSDGDGGEGGDGDDPDGPDTDTDDEGGDDGDPGEPESCENLSTGNQAGRNADNTPLEEPSAETDDAFRELEKELVNENGEGILYLDLPKPDLAKIIIPHKVVLGKYETAVASQFLAAYTPHSMRGAKPMNYIEVSNGLNAAFHKRNKGFVAMLVKEFEMRKNANQYARQLTAKTGELDDKKIARYKLTNDIFRKVTTITKGKSHGMIMFLDFSGSMSGTMREILEQVLVLVTFCKRVGIPFDVYGFGDSHSYNFGGGAHYMWTAVNGGFTFGDDSFCLRHLISSNLSGNAYKRAFTMLNVVGQISNASQRDPESSKCFSDPNYQGNFFQLGFELGGTPFNETLVASKTIIEKFKEMHHVDITNVIYLSDGDGYGNICNGTQYSSVPANERNKTRIGVRDFATKVGVLTDNKCDVPYQTALTKLVAAVTDCRHIGYFFGGEAEIARKVAGNADLRKKLPEHLKFLKDNGFIGVPNLGYDNYYYVNKDQMTYRGELKFYPQTDPNMMGQKFIEHQNRKMNSKLIIKEFATDIAE